MSMSSEAHSPISFGAEILTLGVKGDDGPSNTKDCTDDTFQFEQRDALTAGHLARILLLSFSDIVDPIKRTLEAFAALSPVRPLTSGYICKVVESCHLHVLVTLLTNNKCSLQENISFRDVAPPIFVGTSNMREANVPLGSN